MDNMFSDCYAFNADLCHWKDDFVTSGITAANLENFGKRTYNMRTDYRTCWSSVFSESEIGDMFKDSCVEQYDPTNPDTTNCVCEEGTYTKDGGLSCIDCPRGSFCEKAVDTYERFKTNPTVSV